MKLFLSLIVTIAVFTAPVFSQGRWALHPYGEDHDFRLQHIVLDSGPTPAEILDTMPPGPWVTFLYGGWTNILVGKPRPDGRWDAWFSDLYISTSGCCNPYWEQYSENGLTFSVLTECRAGSQVFQGVEFGSKWLHRYYWILGDTARLYFLSADYEEHYQKKNDGTEDWGYGLAGKLHFSGNKVTMTLACWGVNKSFPDPDLLYQDGITEEEYRLTEEGWIRSKHKSRKFANRKEEMEMKSNYREGSRPLCKWDFEK